MKVSHCYQEAKRVVDKLANLGIDKNIGVIFFNSPPKELMDMLRTDAVSVAWPAQKR